MTERMIDSEYHRLTKLSIHEMTRREVALWREEFAQRNLDEQCRVRELWLAKSEIERASINRAAASVLVRGWRRSHELSR